MGHHSSGRVRLAALVVVALGLAAGGIAYASIPDSNGVIHGCYQKNSGQLRVVDPGGAGGSCSSSESPLAWNQFSGYEVVASPFNETAQSSAFAVFVESASCPPGKVVLGGGVFARFVDAAGNRHPAQLDSSGPTTGNTWDVQLSRSDGGNFDVGEGVLGTVYAICAYAS
jgi:hypothetical protein